MTRAGPLNLITDIAGLGVGNAHDADRRTGVTVLIAERPFVAGYFSPGGAPGTRETDALKPGSLAGAVDAIVFSGGSVYGLGAADEVTSWLGARGRGYKIPISPLGAPIVPAAILFDLANGGNKNWGEEPPYRRLAREACENASREFSLGNAGAGFGAAAGIYKGGLGSASARTADGFMIGALIAANPWGSPVIPGASTLWAHVFEQSGELGRQRAPKLETGIDLDLPKDARLPPAPRANTTIGMVALDADLSVAEAERVALMASAGIARAVRPVFTQFDGDTIFALATGAKKLPEPRAFHLNRLGSIAADCVARALARGVFEAKTLGERRSYREAHPNGFGK